MKNPEVDAYIARSAEFARPILARLRALVHKACPQVEETIKWGVPHFEYQGALASMAAFKQHASFGFWKQKLMADPAGFFPKAGDSSMGGRKIRALSELPSDAVLMRYLRAAVALNEQGARLPPRPPARKPPAKPPADLAAALGKNAKARATFAALTPSKRREYIDWLLEAKQQATRQRRLTQAIQWLAQGKSRYWKYQNC